MILENKLLSVAKAMIETISYFMMARLRWLLYSVAERLALTCHCTDQDDLAGL